MEYLVGMALALAVGALATIVGFDRSRSFYPVILVVIASYYDLFAVMGGSMTALAVETAVSGVFLAVAVTGFRTSLWLIVAALLAHGALDLVHDRIVGDPGVPAWWPMFCLAYDVAAAGYLAVRLRRQGAPAAVPEIRSVQQS